jgi:hypothetical protein
MEVRKVDVAVQEVDVAVLGRMTWKYRMLTWKLTGKDDVEV